MAERNPLNPGDLDGSFEDDPFAELTRIMGFDPRLPVKPAAISEEGGSGTPPTAAAGLSDEPFDDLDLDLERELQGDFARDEFLEDGAVEPEPVAAADPQEFDDPFAELDEAFARSLEADLASGEASAVLEAGEEDRVIEMASDASFDDEFEDVFHLEADEQDSAPEAPYSELGSEPLFDKLSAEAVEPSQVEEGQAEPEPTAARLAADEPDVGSVETYGDRAMERASPAGTDDEEPEAVHHRHFVSVGSEEAFSLAEEPHDPLSLDDLDEAMTASIEEVLAHQPEWQPELSEDADETSPTANHRSRAEEDELPAGDLHSVLAEVDMDFSASRGAQFELRTEPESSFEADLYELLGPKGSSPQGGAMSPVSADDCAYVDEAAALALADGSSAEPHAPDPDFDLPYETVGFADEAFDDIQADEVDPDRDSAPEAFAEPATDESHANGPFSMDAEALGEDAAPESLLLDFDLADLDGPLPGVDAQYALAEAEAAEPGNESSTFLADPVETPSRPLDDDPFAALAAMAARYKLSEPMKPWTKTDSPPRTHPAPETLSGWQEEAPEIDTIDVHEHAVALADDLEIPEVAHGHDAPSAGDFDDLDDEFNSLLHEMSSGEVGVAEEPRAAASTDGSGRRFAAAETHAQHGYRTSPPAPSQWVDEDYPENRSGAYAPRAAEDEAADVAEFGPDASAARLGYDPDMEDDLSLPDYDQADPARKPSRRGLLLASVIGGMAIVGGLGAFALSGAEIDLGSPTLIKADATPVKVKPANPGGTTVADQDSSVYQTAEGAGGAEPTQARLLSTVEEPLEIEPPAPEPAPRAVEAVEALEEGEPEAFAKAEDRVEPEPEDADEATTAEIYAVAPRKVRTMIVKADGTLVPREESAPVADAGDAPATAQEAALDTAAPDAMEAASMVAPASEATASVNADADSPREAGDPGEEAATPVSAPSRPADQPVELVGGDAATQVAAVDPAAAWSVQIASQPSAEAAETSYKDLARRYASVLDGRAPNIVKAEIAGKGTFWRVRMPAATRADAVALCSEYKAAGGNCFVSK